MPKIPPQNLEAEESVLGALMIDKNAIVRVADLLVPSDFYNPGNSFIYQAILKLYEKNQPIEGKSSPLDHPVLWCSSIPIRRIGYSFASFNQG